MTHYISFLLSIILFAGCAHKQEPEPEKTQLEIREFQTRTFDVNDYPLVMKTILNVLQDDGYMVKNANLELGFLSATKEVCIHSARSENEVEIHFASRIGFGFGVGIGYPFPPAREPRSFPTHQCIEATVNVSQFGEKVRVRATFLTKLFDNNEATLRVKQIDNEEFYQDFFIKVDKGIFLQQQVI